MGFPLGRVLGQQVVGRTGNSPVKVPLDTSSLPLGDPRRAPIAAASRPVRGNQLVGAVRLVRRISAGGRARPAEAEGPASWMPFSPISSILLQFRRTEMEAHLHHQPGRERAPDHDGHQGDDLVPVEEQSGEQAEHQTADDRDHDVPPGPGELGHQALGGLMYHCWSKTAPSGAGAQSFHQTQPPRDAGGREQDEDDGALRERRAQPQPDKRVEGGWIEAGVSGAGSVIRSGIRGRAAA